MTASITSWPPASFAFSRKLRAFPRARESSIFLKIQNPWLWSPLSAFAEASAD